MEETLPTRRIANTRGRAPENSPPCNVSRRRKPPNLRVRKFLTFLALIVAGGVEGEFAENFPGLFVDDPRERASLRRTRFSRATIAAWILRCRPR
jgi:hypothetical protein